MAHVGIGELRQAARGRELVAGGAVERDRLEQDALAFVEPPLGGQHRAECAQPVGARPPANLGIDRDRLLGPFPGMAPVALGQRDTRPVRKHRRYRGIFGADPG